MNSLSQSGSDSVRGKTLSNASSPDTEGARTEAGLDPVEMSHSTVATMRLLSSPDSTTATHHPRSQKHPSIMSDGSCTDVEAMYPDLFSDTPFPFFGASHASILSALHNPDDENQLVLSPKDDLVSSTTSLAGSATDPWSSPTSSIMSPGTWAPTI